MIEAITEITLLGVSATASVAIFKTIEQQILNAARGSIMQLAWMTDARTDEPGHQPRARDDAPRRRIDGSARRFEPAPAA